MKVGTKLTVLALLAMPGLIGLVAVDQYQMNKVFDAANYSNSKALPSIILLNQALDELVNIHTKTWQLISHDDKGNKEGIERTIQVSMKKIDNWLRQYEQTSIADDRDRQLLSADRKALEGYDTLRSKVFFLGGQNKIQAARDLLMANQETISKIYQAFQAHRQFNVELGQHHAVKASEFASDALWASLTIASLILVVIGFVGRFTTRSIIGKLGCEPTEAVEFACKIADGDLSFAIDTNGKGQGSLVVAVKSIVDNVKSMTGQMGIIIQAAKSGQIMIRADVGHSQGVYRKLLEGINDTLDAVDGPIEEVVRVLGAVAKGDLIERVNQTYLGVFAKLCDDANTTVDNLAHSVKTIKEAANAINTVSREIAMGNMDLSQRTEEQSVSLAETATSMEVLSSTVKQNADNARQANQMSVMASDVAMKGGKLVRQVVLTMDDINESSQKIVDIISVIDSIAFQTNILALNAAVEAARAGEQGRGFAVVANEVRNLAQRSASAAKDIKSLIGNSVDKVKHGSKLVAEAGQTMDEIVTSVKRVTDIMGEIAVASIAQSSGIEHVKEAITQMDEVTQQNAALVEQAAIASESLEEQTQRLAVLMSRFRLTNASDQPSVVFQSTDVDGPVEARVAENAKIPSHRSYAATKHLSKTNSSIVD